MSRHCHKCKVVQPYTEFYKDKYTTDGYARICKSCTTLADRIKYHKRKVKPEFKAAKRLSSKRYMTLHPERAKAHSLASRHKDELKKDACEHCGTSGKLHMHHPDYSQPLKVITLCIRCHEIVHHGQRAAL